ncbi:hypothetical protein [Roseovarius albus]|uniref:hypothetical protein n=1 Tax=Roseovarius albus TaxID=1247867 RepID=UPI001179FC47|nr:hypothetical protein [Roseovarius albus]
MNWAAIEGIASVAGAIGVVISITFLIYEVRHNARAIEGATVQSLMTLEREVFGLLAENAELMTKGGKNPAALTDVEQYQYERGVGTYMSLIYSAYMQHERELVEDEVWDAYLNALARHMQAPGFSESWLQISIGYPKSFQDLIKERFPQSSQAKSIT